MAVWSVAGWRRLAYTTDNWDCLSGRRQPVPWTRLGLRVLMSSASWRCILVGVVPQADGTARCMRQGERRQAGTRRRCLQLQREGRVAHKHACGSLLAHVAAGGGCPACAGRARGSPAHSQRPGAPAPLGTFHASCEKRPGESWTADRAWAGSWSVAAGRQHSAADAAKPPLPHTTHPAAGAASSTWKTNKLEFLCSPGRLARMPAGALCAGFAQLVLAGGSWEARPNCHVHPGPCLAADQLTPLQSASSLRLMRCSMPAPSCPDSLRLSHRPGALGSSTNGSCSRLADLQKNLVQE